MKVRNYDEAWKEASKLTKYDFDYDIAKSKACGYPVYSNDAGEWISDLGTRLEVNAYPKEGKQYIHTTNIWIVKDLETSGFHKNALGIWVLN